MKTVLQADLASDDFISQKSQSIWLNTHWWNAIQSKSWFAYKTLFFSELLE